MAQTITQKILAAHCGRDEVHAGEIIMADIDLALGNDITAPISIKILREHGIKEVFDRDKIALVPDHFAPNKDIASAQQGREATALWQGEDAHQAFLERSLFGSVPLCYSVASPSSVSSHTSSDRIRSFHPGSNRSSSIACAIPV